MSCVKKVWRKVVTWVRGHPKFVLVVVAAVVFVAITQPSISFGIDFGGDSEAEVAPNFPTSGPAEFLYLDPARVDAYLAQIDGGSYESEKKTKKLTNSLKAKLSVADTLESGGESAEENFEEREVKPTEANRVQALAEGLVASKELAKPTLAQFEWEGKPIGEGQFVRFNTSELVAPAYLKPYLASRRSVSALQSAIEHHKPPAGDKTPFLRDLGREPRAVLAVQTKSGSVYLMPIEAQLLSNERSLLKYGGGEFTVLGKVVRVFSESDDEHGPAYKDSATQEEWERAIPAVPRRLVCRSDRVCAEALRNGNLDAAETRTAMKAARRRDWNSLLGETVIREEGAVILPIAIYK